MKEVRLAYPLDLIERIGGYLVTRPYAEVASLIAGLQQGVKVDVEIPDGPGPAPAEAR